MQRLVRTATSQHGLITTSQLHTCGVTKRRRRSLVDSGLLVPVRRGVVRLAASLDTWEQRLLAVCLTPGLRLVASHRSALRLWSLRSSSDELEVAVRYPGNRALTGVTVHRSVDLVEGDITDVDGIPVTTPARTLCDAGLIFPEHEVQRLVDHAVATGLATTSELIDVRRRVGEHGRNGVGPLDGAIDGLPVGAARSESGPELKLRRLLVDAGLPEPARQYEVDAGTRTWRLDLAYPNARLGLEYDGVDVHTRVDGFVSDRRRQNDLVERGWTIFRYTHADLREHPGALVRQVRHQLQASLTA